MECLRGEVVKIVVLSEAGADEAALRILTEALLGQPVQLVERPTLLRGWPGVRTALRSGIGLLLGRQDVEALVCVVDADMTPVHEPSHDHPIGRQERCRLCQMRDIVAQVQTSARARRSQPPLQVALGLAVPTIEAWYRCGLDPQVSETTWQQGRMAQPPYTPYTATSLKRAVYGTDRPDIHLATQRASDAARRLSQDLSLLTTHFPNGFGPLAREIQRWGGA